MSNAMTVESVMTAYPYSIEAGSHLNSAKAMLTQFNIRHLPVKRDGEIVGVVTERDISRVEDLGVDTSIGSDALVQEVCNMGVYTVTPDAELISVLRHMADNHVDAALVTKDDKLIGIFTLTDACRRYADCLTQCSDQAELNATAQVTPISLC